MHSAKPYLQPGCFRKDQGLKSVGAHGFLIGDFVCKDNKVSWVADADDLWYEMTTAGKFTSSGFQWSDTDTYFRPTTFNGLELSRYEVHRLYLKLTTNTIQFEMAAKLMRIGKRRFLEVVPRWVGYTDAILAAGISGPASPPGPPG